MVYHPSSPRASQDSDVSITVILYAIALSVLLTVLRELSLVFTILNVFIRANCSTVHN
eukprot:m.25336 g.25336  ORF g.25336 m.25336 type:complete len:58 (+) comp28780_c0_seq3:141-314(+)